MSKVKVLRIIARLNIGGPAQHAAILSQGLESARYDPLLIYGSIEKGEGDMSYLLPDAARSVFLPELKRGINPMDDSRAFARILGIMKKERPHIVHTHTAKAGTLGRLAAIIAGVPIKVHTFHGHVFSGYFNRFAETYFLFIERFLARFTDRIVAISARQKDELLKRYKIGAADKYSVVRLGLDLGAFLGCEARRGDFRKRYGLKDDDILVGIVGRIVPIKNHTMFMQAIRRLKDGMDGSVFSRVKFIIAGDGPQKKSLMEFSASLGISDKVLFTGWEKDTAGLYADLDIVALTSDNEGTPLSLIEALAAAKTVVATDVGGVRDVVGDAGLVVARGDEGTFAKRLSEAIMLLPEERRRIGLKGRELVVKDYSKERLIKDVERMYESLLIEKGITI